MRMHMQAHIHGTRARTHTQREHARALPLSTKTHTLTHRHAHAAAMQGNRHGTHSPPAHPALSNKDVAAIASQFSAHISGRGGGAPASGPAPSPAGDQQSLSGQGSRVHWPLSARAHRATHSGEYKPSPSHRTPYVHSPFGSSATPQPPAGAPHPSQPSSSPTCSSAGPGLAAACKHARRANSTRCMSCDGTGAASAALSLQNRHPPPVSARARLSRSASCHACRTQMHMHPKHVSTTQVMGKHGGGGGEVGAVQRAMPLATRTCSHHASHTPTGQRLHARAHPLP